MIDKLWLMIAVAVLIVILAIIFIKRKKKPKKISALTGLAFACIILGIVFANDKILGYCLIGAGVVIAVIDMIISMKKSGK